MSQKAYLADILISKIQNTIHSLISYRVFSLYIELDSEVDITFARVFTAVKN
jgi:hypothetical protein